MYEQHDSTWGAQHRFAWTGRILLALIGGVAFALVAWEPPNSKSKDGIDNAALPIGVSAIQGASARPQRDSPGNAREFDETIGWTPKRDKYSKQGDLYNGELPSETATTSARGTIDPNNKIDSPAIVNPHSRSPPG